MDKKFVRLEKKYSKLCQNYRKIKNKISQFEKIPQAVINSFTKEGLYLKRVSAGANSWSGIIYLKNTEIGKNRCDICGKRRKTTGHHIIPRRVKSVNKYLSQIRVRVCDECNRKIHPENRELDREGIIERQNEIIIRLTRKINKKVEEDILPFYVSFLEKRIKELTKEVRRIPKNLIKIGKKKEIHLAINRIRSRISEAGYIRRELKHKISRTYNTKR